MTTNIYVSTTIHQHWGGPARYIRVIIHDTHADFMRAAERYEWGPTIGDGREPWGLFTPARPKQKYNLSTSEFVDVTDKHWAGLVRLSWEHFDYEIVAHEMVHAACQIYRMDVKPMVNLGFACRPNEETLAYMVGNLYGRFIDAIQKLGDLDEKAS